ncbi:hypothetical protein [Pseudarthrobacter sp. GA104]|uniref:hypothetical protein n=1 Tax=Pseudarthrobacter sp. GA104 TaxID=2676311 RepID=UPI0012FA8D1D|nr:hypothetical protein [Pseudarthrobacter sp. GA104]MUU73455.1 hypothetical protein [Pseudarthrobacter sp. GA104]
MAGTEKRLSLKITARQANFLLDALYDKTVETDHYLIGYRNDENPGPLDTCCDAHLARFKDRARQREALVERKTQLQGLITLIEALKPMSETSDEPEHDPEKSDHSND